MALSRSSLALVVDDGTAFTHVSQRYPDVPMGLLMLNRVKQDWRVLGWELHAFYRAGLFAPSFKLETMCVGLLNGPLKPQHLLGWGAMPPTFPLGFAVGGGRVELKSILTSLGPMGPLPRTPRTTREPLLAHDPRNRPL